MCPKLYFSIIGYAHNFYEFKRGRQTVENKLPLEAARRNKRYTIQCSWLYSLEAQRPPAFIVYSGSDPVVPVINAYRLARGVQKASAAVELEVFSDAPIGLR
ncbi:hypothetical protein EJ02DRAFT_473922 [Clathrospora elynae]|uniref:Peptidase S9 prolyl oligopeptidase catalytic domain-containing protein n=1 Tax=Clathrospora elynae TaxID=706981 RepID=A0A6A5SCK7_9PLEO|nr:hypothetical protein EJ02DRAFT_473922 [Clathrospora elynae]